jgi:hypothetical protein
MKAFGYVRGDSAAEHPVALQEVTLSVTIKELERVITFLQQAKSKLQHQSATPGQSHLHLKDLDKAWTPEDPDVIVVVAAIDNR